MKETKEMTEIDKEMNNLLQLLHSGSVMDNNTKENIMKKVVSLHKKYIGLMLDKIEKDVIMDKGEQMSIKRLKCLLDMKSTKDRISMEDKVYDELEKDFEYVIANAVLIPGQTHLPQPWELHIRKCIEKNYVGLALVNLEGMKSYCKGTLIDFQPMEQYIKGTKEYKEYIMQKKKEKIKRIFE